MHPLSPSVDSSNPDATAVATTAAGAGAGATASYRGLGCAPAARASSSSLIRSIESAAAGPMSAVAAAVLGYRSIRHMLLLLPG